MLIGASPLLCKLKIAVKETEILLAMKKKALTKIKKEMSDLNKEISTIIHEVALAPEASVANSAKTKKSENKISTTVKKSLRGLTLIKNDEKIDFKKDPTVTKVGSRN